jgi:hypothetical protein
MHFKIPTIPLKIDKLINFVTSISRSLFLKQFDAGFACKFQFSSKITGPGKQISGVWEKCISNAGINNEGIYPYNENNIKIPVRYWC